MEKIILDLEALTGTQKSATWTDLTSGSEPKWWFTKNEPELCVIHWQITDGPSLTAAQKLDLKLHAVAIYVQDNPSWLVHPAFDSTINVDGTEPIP